MATNFKFSAKDIEFLKKIDNACLISDPNKLSFPLSVSEFEELNVLIILVKRKYEQVDRFYLVSLQSRSKTYFYDTEGNVKVSKRDYQKNRHLFEFIL